MFYIKVKIYGPKSIFSYSKIFMIVKKWKKYAKIHYNRIKIK